MGSFEIVRLFRGPSSERFVLREAESVGHERGSEVAIIDLHFLNGALPSAGGAVEALLVLFEDGPLREADIPSLLEEIDDLLLAESAADVGRRVNFTVMVGHAVGTFSPES